MALIIVSYCTMVCYKLQVLFYLAQFSAEPENGETALHLAACKNNEKMISFLLDLGASPNMVDLKGRSPAMRAAEFGHTQTLRLLTEAATDMTSKS